MKLLCVCVCFARAMSQGVKGHQVNERKAKIREQKRDEELRRYHNDILAAPEETATSDVTLPPIQNRDAVEHHMANVCISRQITMYNARCILYCVTLCFSGLKLYTIARIELVQSITKRAVVWWQTGCRQVLVKFCIRDVDLRTVFLKTVKQRIDERAFTCLRVWLPLLLYFGSSTQHRINPFRTAFWLTMGCRCVRIQVCLSGC